MEKLSMKEEAQLTLAQHQRFEHERMMNATRKIYNAVVLFAVFILILAFGPKWWQLVFLVVVDFADTIKIFKQLYNRWGK